MNWLAQMEARRLVLSLREMLVRFDENLAADTLMQSCVPYVLEGDPEVARARVEQRLKVQHIVGDHGAYASYYASNAHEQPFERQHGCEPEEAHERLHRVAFLRDWLDGQPGQPLRLLDCACNDGWMAVNLAQRATYYGLDLNPGCIERAKARKVLRARFAVGHAEEAQRIASSWGVRGFDVVVAYELIEHVRDPDAVLAAMVSVCRPGGSLFVSTPLGACTGGDLPAWWVVEPAGHVRAFTPRSFGELLARHGRCDGITISEASQGQLMVARVQVPDAG